LTQCLAALRANCLDEALRQIDRAWRISLDESAELVWIYGLLLSLEGRDQEAALGLLQRVTTPDADVYALRSRTLLCLDRVEEARQILNSALADFCIVAGGLLEHVADEIIEHPSNRAAGWIGRAASLEFTGRLVAAEPAKILQIQLNTGAEFLQPLRTSLHNGRLAFQFKPPAIDAHEILEVSSRGVALLGGRCFRIPRFGLDGRTSSQGRKLSGWVRLNWSAGEPVSLRIVDEHGHSVEKKTALLPRSTHRRHFHIDLRRTPIAGHRIHISALLPTGEWQSLPGMPLLLEPALRLRGGAAPRLSRWKPLTSARGPELGQRARVDVIIPVYRGREESLACIAAALATAGDARVVVVDDATPDAELAAALDELELNGSITLLRNARNVGFVGSVNRALARSRRHDAVLLNADAVVFGDWLERLQAAAYRDRRIGTVTPFSNSGSIASYPRTSHEPMRLEEAAQFDRLAAAAHDGVAAEIPVGVGFCLYVKRACLEQVGEFDESVFGKGYGEETDFCLRARRRGWSHALAADVFVYHAGARSFGAERDALLDRSQRLLNLRHPGFDRYIADFLARDPLQPLRRGLDEQRLAAFPGRFVLLVTLALSGGVARFVAERCRTLRTQGLLPLVLRPSEAGNSRRCELWTDALDVPNLQYDIPADLAALTQVLRGLALHSIEIQHFLHLDARVIEAVRSLGPYETVIHDYAWICPRVTLIDGSGRYCGEPSLVTCEACVKRNGSELPESISVADLRERSAQWLRQARRVLAPSADTAARIQKYVDVDVVVEPHTTMPAPAPIAARPSAGAVIRVALIGAIGDHKGYRVLRDCARDAQARGLPLEFVVIGHTQNDGALLKTGNVFITGRFGDGEVAHLLRRERPDMIFMASVWPETWSYVLDDALAARLPVVAFDLGAIAERLRAARLGTLLPLAAQASYINEIFLRLARSTVPARPCYMEGVRKSEDEPMQNPPAIPSGVSALPDTLSASVQILPLTSGLYLFSVKTAAPPDDADGNGQLLRLPALHVGLGPGVRAEQVDFVQGHKTEGAWLFAREDYLVANVHGVGATLVLTSVRGPGGETLSIKIERLDARIDAVAAASAGPPVAEASPAEAAAPPREAAPAKSAGRKRPSSEGPEAHLPLPVEIGAHIRTRGDLTFTGVSWAGRVGSGLWIESFSVKPLRHFEARDIEYKGLTGSGFETPWLSNAAMCGTKGMAVPLLGFAIRLKRSAEAAAFDCEYSGYFKSGVTVGPLRNGAPCRSTVANDPLEGIQVHIRKRSQLSAPAGKPDSETTPPAAAKPGRTKVLGPSFGRYRDAGEHKPPAAVAPARKPAAGKAKRSSARRH
jgi:GT2 family glycosyltransferase/glycosyltransferase involved in cell wall biosynthesis